jgi:DNA-binding CsgD family transcriptional regulator
MKEVQSLRRSPSCGFEAELPGLIEALGRPDFSQRLFQVARKFTDCHTVTSFAFGGSRSPRLLFAENVGDVPVSRRIAKKYIADYWRFDPVNLMATDAVHGAACRTMMIGADDIAHASYREHCYAAVKLDNRMTILRATEGNVIRVNIYRGRGNSAFDRGIEAIAAAGDTLIALLARHDVWAAMAEGGEDFEYLDRLRYICPSLPKRELEVCALIMRGFSSEAIALKLGISLNTVLTFRRRAYARLRISSQNELMRLVLS